MAAVSTNIKIESTLKQKSQELFESLGMNLSTAVNVFLRQSVRKRAIPFRIGEPVPNAETLKAIEESRRGINVRGPFSTVEELMEDLDAED